MFRSMCMYIYTLHVHVSTGVQCIHIHERKYRHTYLYVHTYISICVYIHVYIYVHLHTYGYIHACMPTFIPFRVAGRDLEAEIWSNFGMSGRESSKMWYL